MPIPVLWLGAVALFAIVAFGGITALRGASGGPVHGSTPPDDVEDLDLYFVCVECGTEYRVTRLGEVQPPRHCGAPMVMTQRPGGSDPADAPGKG